MGKDLSKSETKISVRSANDVVLGSMQSTEIVPTRQSDLANDDNTVKDENYSDRVFASWDEKTEILSKIGSYEQKTGWIGSMASFTDPSAWQAELTAFVTSEAGRSPQEGDQVTVTGSHIVYQYGSDGLWFQFATNSSGLTFESEFVNDDYTVKDANYSSRVFTDAAEKTATMNHIAELEKKTYFVGSMTDFTDPTAYQTELSDFVNATLSRVAQEGDQVSVTDLGRIYQYGSDGQWFVLANAAENLTKQSELINDDNTVKDANYSSRVFASGAEKAATLAQVDANTDDIVDLKAEDVNLQNQIDRLQKKTFWVGSFANFTDPSAYEAELTAFVTTKLSRAPQEGDQVSVTELSKVYQYSSSGDWQVFSSTLLIDTASKVNTGVVKIGDGIDVDSDGVISVSDEATGLNMKVLTTVTLETWTEDDANVASGRCVSIYASVATDGIAAPAIYRVYKKDEDNILIDCFAVGTGRCYHKIKCDGSWSQIDSTCADTVSWGEITGDLSNQTDLMSALNQKIDTDKIVDNLTTDDPNGVLTGTQGRILHQNKVEKYWIVDHLASEDSLSVLSARQGKALNDGKISTSQIADNLTTDDATKVLSARQGKILKDKFATGGATKLTKNSYGGLRQPIYISSGTPSATPAHTNRTLICNGVSRSVAQYGTSSDNITWYAPTIPGESGFILESLGSNAPTWEYPLGDATSTSGFQFTQLHKDSAIPYKKKGTYEINRVFDYTLINMIFTYDNTEKVEHVIINPATYRTSSAHYLFDTRKKRDYYFRLYFEDYSSTTTKLHVESINCVALQAIYGISVSATLKPSVSF